MRFIWQRLKNIWAWSAMHPYDSTQRMPSEKKRTGPILGGFNPRSAAKIIKRHPVDPIDEVVNSL